MPLHGSPLIPSATRDGVGEGFRRRFPVSVGRCVGAHGRFDRMNDGGWPQHLVDGGILPRAVREIDHGHERETVDPRTGSAGGKAAGKLAIEKHLVDAVGLLRRLRHAHHSAAEAQGNGISWR